MTRRFANVLFVASLACLVASSTTSMAGENVQRNPEVILEQKNDTSAPLREMAKTAVAPVKQRLVLPVQRRAGFGQVAVGPDSAYQTSVLPNVGTTSGLNFDGITDRDGVAPPDTNAAVGVTQVVETVNTSYQVFDKTTGGSVFGPVEISSIWSGFSGLCQTGSLSDPVVLYDQIAGRWLVSSVAFNTSFTSFVECIAVSTSSDATGSFNRYSYSFGKNLNDYPKLSVWPDAYYASYNIFQNAAAFIGAEVCAYDRTSMLAGSPATSICFQRSTADFSFLPSDLDGATLPPTGEPDFFLELNTATTMNLYKFHVDFTTPSKSTFTGPTTITTASYTQACAATGTCIPQGGTSQQLDSLGDRLMHRLAYRNLGTYQSLLATHSVKGAATVSAVRWYEIRYPNAKTPQLYQQGTYGNKSYAFWMGSIAQDKLGDIAVGFSFSSSTSHPGIAYTGRVPTDKKGTMESAAIIIRGTGSQTGGLSRWGDYSSMAIDPSDDCTFWYAQEYLKSTGSFNWNTRLASFKFPSCQ